MDSILKGYLKVKEDIPAILAEAIFCFSTTYQGIWYALIEALAAKLISLYWYPCREFLDMVNWNTYSSRKS